MAQTRAWRMPSGTHFPRKVNGIVATVYRLRANHPDCPPLKGKNTFHLTRAKNIHRFMSLSKFSYSVQAAALLSGKRLPGYHWWKYIVKT